MEQYMTISAWRTRFNNDLKPVKLQTVIHDGQRVGKVKTHA
jgi:hypothetical protein